MINVSTLVQNFHFQPISLKFYKIQSFQPKSCYEGEGWGWDDRHLLLASAATQTHRF